MFPDTSNVMNGPQTGKYHMYPAGGVTIRELIEAGSSMGTVALGPLASGPAARALDTKCKVPCEILNLPIGLTATDTFIDTLRRIAGVTVPDSINIERGQLLDVITDMQQYFYRPQGGPGRGPGSTHFPYRVFGVHRHVAHSYRHRHPGEEVRSPDQGDHQGRAASGERQERRRICSCCTSGSKTTRWTC